MHTMSARRRASAVLAALVAAITTVTTLAVTAGSPATAAPQAPGQVAKGEVGSWSVVSLGDGRYEVSWRSPKRFPITSDRPTIVGSADLRFGPPTVAADGRTVTAVVTADAAPDPADLDVVLSGDRLDAVGDDAARAGSAPARALDLPGTVTLDDDPATPGPFEVETSDYELEPVKLPRMREPIEMVGHVVEPAADAETGPRPLVLFLHGRHSYCYDPGNDFGDGDWPCQAPLEEIPSQLGYDYMQQVLASQGYATVSVRVNGINAQDYRLADGGADARAEIVEAHLRHWVGLADEHQVDLDRVVLVGHSRGGEGVNRASIQIPLSAPYRIAGQVLIAPTDFASQTAPYVPTVTLLPFCDGDVSDLQGQKFTDTARDLTVGDTSLKSSVMVMGANHNYFNTEWTPGLAVAPAWDDWGGPRKAECGKKNADRLSPEEQQAVGTAYVAGAVHLFADGDQDVLPLFDGTRARVESTGDAQVLSHAIGGGRDLRAPGRGLGRALPDGATTRFCSGVFNTSRIASCASGGEPYGVHPHWPDSYENLPGREFFQMDWTAAGQSGGVVLDDPLDLSERRLELRTIVDPSVGPADLRVRITDADGESALLTPVGGGGLPVLGKRADTRKLWAETVVADPAGAAGVDLASIVRVDLVSANDRGRVWVADLAAAPATLAAVPDTRLPSISIGNVRVPEGDGNRVVTAELPFTIAGEVTRPARFSVVTTGQERGSVQRFNIDLAPGQTSGSIPVTYRSDRRDDFPRIVTQASALPVRNVMTDAYLGSLTVLDDDPTPKLRIKAASRRIEAGETATWTISMAKPVDYDMFVSARIVRGPSPTLAADDVPASWFRKHVGIGAEPGKALWSYRPSLFEQLRTGDTSVELTVPTVAGAAAEGRKSITLRLRVNKTRAERTIWVS